MLRAKPTAWVTTIIDIPPAARSDITARMPFTSSGSGAEVASSKIMMSGFMAKCPRDRHPLLLAAGQIGVPGHAEVVRAGARPGRRGRFRGAGPADRVGRQAVTGYRAVSGAVVKGSNRCGAVL